MICKLLNKLHPRKIAVKFLRMKFFKILPDEIYVKIRYYLAVGEKIDFNDLVTYYHKINWLKFNYKDELLKICSDKYKVREYISQKVGEHVLVPIYAVYNNTEDIDFNILPNEFALKLTGGSGKNIICFNKLKLDRKKTLKLLNKWLNEDDYYWREREWCYKDNESKIICEKLLKDNGSVPKDYKVYCFSGKPAYIAVFHDRFSQIPSQTIYDIDWNVVPGVMDYHFVRNEDKIEKRPSCYYEMISIAEKLSKDFLHVRVDFYIVDEKLFVGELTFFNASGATKMIPQELDIEVGLLIDLDKINNNGKYVE